jgi:hypothetical protein
LKKLKTKKHQPLKQLKDKNSNLISILKDKEKEEKKKNVLSKPTKEELH